MSNKLLAVVVAALLLAASIFSVRPVLAQQQTLDLASHAGKVVIVDFWASWCVPCRRSFPWLNAMQAKYQSQGLVIVGINLDNVPDDARAFLEDYPAEFKIVYDADRSVAREFEVVAMPSSYLIGRDGELRERHLGFKVQRQAEYETAIIAALREQLVEHVADQIVEGE